LRTEDPRFLWLGLCATLLAIGVAIADEQDAPTQGTAAPTASPDTDRESASPPSVRQSAKSLDRRSKHVRSRTLATPGTIDMPTPLDSPSGSTVRLTTTASKGLSLAGAMMKDIQRAMAEAPDLSPDVGASTWKPEERDTAKPATPRKPEWWIFASRPGAEVQPGLPAPTRRWWVRTCYVVTVSRSCRVLNRSSQDRSSPGVGFAVPELVGTDGVQR
jgi:hypothetical protein